MAPVYVTTLKQVPLEQTLPQAQKLRCVYLHTPMYFFISGFSFLEIWYTTIIIPKILSNVVCELKTISLAGCVLQMYFFHFLVITEISLLITMTIDRCLAICSPFCYPTIMTPQLYTQLTCYLAPLPEIAWISTVSFCGSNQIQSIICNFDLILNLTCIFTDIIVLIKVVDIVHAVEIITTLMLVMGYVCIIAVILCICSVDLHQKAFSTCASHFSIFLIFFAAVPSIYLRFSAKHSCFLAISLMFAVLSPFFNPISYSLRRKEIKEDIEVYVCQPTIFEHHIK
ncbi:LOW QUALITY PROTEIN: olfactory receptor 6K2-like [Hipposideros larvatus]